MEREKLTLRERWQRNKSFLGDFVYWFKTNKINENGEASYAIKYRTVSEKLACAVVIWPLMIITAALTVLCLQWLARANFLQDWSYILWRLVYYLVRADRETGFFDSIQKLIIENPYMFVFYSCIFAPVWEEYLWRRLWLGGSMQTIDITNMAHAKETAAVGRRSYLLPFMLNSIIFGLAHGSPINILIQGVGGMYFSYIYMRTGRTIWTAMLSHSLYNSIWAFFMLTGAWKNTIFVLMW